MWNNSGYNVVLVLKLQTGVPDTANARRRLWLRLDEWINEELDGARTSALMFRFVFLLELVWRTNSWKKRGGRALEMFANLTKSFCYEVRLFLW